MAYREIISLAAIVCLLLFACWKAGWGTWSPHRYQPRVTCNTCELNRTPLLWTILCPKCLTKTKTSWLQWVSDAQLFDPRTWFKGHWNELDK